MATSEEIWQQRSRSFGAVAREYDRARPSYPAQAIDEIVAAMPGPNLVESGAGTGKATALFAARGLAITAIEPDAEMALVLAERVAGSVRPVEIVTSTLEQWQPKRRYDGLAAAQSWHWTEPASRYRKAADALVPNGILALFWNIVEWQQTPLHAEIDDIYARHGVSRVVDQRQANATPDQHVRAELAALPTFTDVEVHSYPWQRQYPVGEWIDYLVTMSDHLLLEPGRRAALLADVRRLIVADGGVLPITHRCDLFLARRRARPA